MQRHPIKLGSFDDQHPGRQFILKDAVARFALVAFIIPLAILRNGFRILVIALLCVNIGPQMIHSVIHRRGGPIFFALSLIPLFALLWWLRKGETRARPEEPHRASQRVRTSDFSSRASFHFTHFLGNLALLFPEKRLREACSPASDT